MVFEKEKLLGEYYQHLRHVENYRFWFVNMYFFIISIIITFISKMNFNSYTLLFASIFMIIISYFGNIIIGKSGAVVANYNRSIESLLLSINLQKNEMPIPVEDKRSISRAYEKIFHSMMMFWSVLIFLSLYLIVNDMSLMSLAQIQE